MSDIYEYYLMKATGGLSINTECTVVHQQLLPMSPTTLFSSPYSINIPGWCVTPKHEQEIEEISAGSGRKIFLGNSAYHIIGRNEKASIMIENLMVSRRHAALLHHVSGEYYLVDLDSAHGSYIGKVKLTPYVPTLLKNGSIMR